MPANVKITLFGHLSNARHSCAMFHCSAVQAMGTATEIYSSQQFIDVLLKIGTKTIQKTLKMKSDARKGYTSTNKKVHLETFLNLGT